MYGLTSCFVAGLSSAIVEGIKMQEEFFEAINLGVRKGIISAHKYFLEGFGTNINEFIFPNPKIFIESSENFVRKEQVQDIVSS